MIEITARTQDDINEVAALINDGLEVKAIVPLPNVNSDGDRLEVVVKFTTLPSNGDAFICCVDPLLSFAVLDDFGERYKALRNAFELEYALKHEYEKMRLADEEPRSSLIYRTGKDLVAARFGVLKEAVRAVNPKNLP
jgi:hypothetical protein